MAALLDLAGEGQFIERGNPLGLGRLDHPDQA